MKKIYTILFFTFVFLFFIFIGSVNANTLNSITMDVFVDDNGDANVTEIWDYTVNSGTENYHSFKRIGNSEFTNLSVSDENTDYTFLSSWNINASFEDKAYKCGINEVSDGIEICWGISSYGRHTYTISYTITNFVSELNDSQMIYWELISSGNTKGNVYIKIYSNFDYDFETPVWGYGNYGGTCYVYDGYIEMQSDGKLDTDEYMTILAKFPKGTFNTSNVLNKDFNYYYEMAEKGTTSPTTGFIIFSLCFIIAIFCVVINQRKKSSNFSFGTEGKKIPKDVPYFRDIPCKKDIFRAYYIGYQYKLIKNKTDLLGALILKWAKEEFIRIEKTDQKVFIVFIKNSESLKDYYEQRLFKILNEASVDGCLENNEFEKWCAKNETNPLSYFDKILEREKFELIEEGLIIAKNKKYEATPELKQEAKELAGLKRYLKEYTLIKDREAIEVSMFEEYLIYAQLMGIAEKVAKDFKDLYPEIVEQSNFISYDTIVFIHTYADNIIRSSSIAEIRASSYSSGGGGFSSGGGRRRLFWWTVDGMGSR